ncbi:AraC family transcriptional regulator [Halobacillus massiliensis]|uniref:AraC family transcriptional regulator n=1 Tax=Halobacillus massiliensis TaxID=1926286 RepID=UPI0009E460B7|nr:helix-turn-helix domain-containing protein [Halobacillus massiliensis]
MNFYLPIQSPFLTGEEDSDYVYREYAPNPMLHQYVACYWSLNYYASKKEKIHRILPDGCVDIIFDLTAPSLSKAAFVTGLMTRFEVINFTSNQELFGIRFFSNYSRSFIKYPAQNLTGYQVFLEDIWGKEALPFTQEVMDAQGMKEKIEVVEVKLMSLLNKKRSLPSLDLLQAGLQYIYEGRGGKPIQSLSRELNYSERSIRRAFKEELGVSPKEFSRIVRFQSLLKELYHHPQEEFLKIALKYGYYDQAHFINEFKQFYGMVPSRVFPHRK